MHKPAFLASTLLFSALLTGCVGTGPSTERGAVTGGVLGALAGGIIGNNSRGGDTVGGAVLGAAAGAIAGGVMGNSVDHERGTIYGPSNPPPGYGSPDDRRYRVSRAQAIPPPPPTPTETMPPAPAPNAVWVPGYWIYDGRAFTWMSGRWEIPPPFAHAYVPAHSEVRNGQPVYVPGYWQ
ncbi:MAG: hypothetical protein Q7S40_31660 [Opitutaceae bacterium]|nr:hypothetical protein [Opitutaceae bacterium]